MICRFNKTGYDKELEVCGLYSEEPSPRFIGVWSSWWASAMTTKKGLLFYQTYIHLFVCGSFHLHCLDAWECFLCGSFHVGFLLHIHRPPSWLWPTINIFFLSFSVSMVLLSYINRLRTRLVSQTKQDLTNILFHCINANVASKQACLVSEKSLMIICPTTLFLSGLKRFVHQQIPPWLARIGNHSSMAN